MMKNKRIIIIFLAFFAFVMLQLHFVWLYYDDYGYVSLSYFGSSYTGNTGMNTNLEDIISFLKYHYNNWGGRTLWFFVEIVLLRIGINAYRVFQAIVTTGIFYVLYKIVAQCTEETSWLVALASVLCFGTIQIMVIRDGLYWFTASAIYFLPLLPLLAYVLLYDRDVNEKQLKTHSCTSVDGLQDVLLAIMVFISAWSQEQVSVLITTFVALLFIHKLIVLRTANKRDLIMLIICLVGFGILALAPGTRIRAGTNPDFYNLSLLTKIRVNLPVIVELNFGSDTRIFSILFFLSSIYMMIDNRAGKGKWIIDLSVGSSLLMLLVSGIRQEGYFTYVRTFPFSNSILTALSYLQLALLFFNIIWYFYNKKQYKIVYIFIGAIMSQAIMLFAPYIPHRSVIMFEIVSFVIIIFCFSELLRKSKRLGVYILFPVMIISLFNYASITRGYYINDSIRRYNDSILREASRKAAEGEQVEKVVLEPCEVIHGVREPDSVYYLMKQYYGIPNEVEIEYRKVE